MEMFYRESFVVTDQTMKTMKVFYHKQIILYGTVYMQNRATQWEDGTNFYIITMHSYIWMSLKDA